MSSGTTPGMRLLGFQVRTADSSAVVGEVEGVRAAGIRVRVPGRPRRAGYLPREAIGRVDTRTDTVFLVPGIGPEQVAGAPPPPDERPEGWHKSAEWWADLLGHYGLFDSAGRGNEPVLHPGQR